MNRPTEQRPATATQRRIDTARDTLVGRLPEPKSQVEQIVISLICQLMDAMAAEIEAEQAPVAAHRGLIARFEQTIQATLARVRGEAAARRTRPGSAPQDA